MKLLLIPFFAVLTLFSASSVYAQNPSDTLRNKNTGGSAHVSEPPIPSSQVFTYVEQMPEFPGGSAAMLKFMQDHIQYPEQAKKAGAQGKVYVSIIIDRDGNVTEPAIIRDPGYGLGQEAVKVIKAMPKWKPGKQNGQAVPVKMTIPVGFVLQ